MTLDKPGKRVLRAFLTYEADSRRKCVSCSKSGVLLRSTEGSNPSLSAKCAGKSSKDYARFLTPILPTAAVSVSCVKCE